ncbi:hypothetical protein SAY87_007905 [Trapa incisa]|uniref:LOB domain-containing protein n=1 Tax=Trapa incisa TaxID=236973 RepID=A0AAN7QG39_9MYRT|nr:hypothetical protein SAY87_007905 [Trapa incisa]
MGGNSPCASCKLLRRRCAKDCIFAPYFPSDDPHRFAIVHKVFGASNVSKMLQELPIHQRADAVNSLVYEANARVRDPVYGCVGAISYLQNQVAQLQMQLAVAQAEILCIQVQQEPMILPSQPPQPAATATGIMDEKSGFGGLLHNNVLPAQYLNFASSSNVTTTHVDSLKRESFLGHDMVS